MIITHKRGDSFEHLAKIPLPAVDTEGNPTGFANGFFVGWTVSAQVRTAQGKLLGNLTCTWVDPVTTRILSVVATAVQTQTWDVGLAEMDVQFVRTSDGRTMSTATFQITVIKDVTRSGP